MAARRRLVLIVNTKSRQGDSLLAETRRLLAAEAIELLAVRALRDPDQLLSAVREAMALRPDVVVLGAGDGSVSRVVDVLAGTNVALGVLPFGTTNNYARTLGLPLSLPEAVRIAATGQIQPVDLGHVGNDYFANVASIGLSTRIARSVSPRLKRIIGRLAYAVAGARSLLAHRAFAAILVADGKTHRLRTHQLVVANGRFHAGHRISAQASPTNGQLTVFTFGSASKWQLLANTVRFNMYGIEGLRGADTFVTNRVEIATVPARSVELDGEISGRTPAVIEVVPRAILVVRPA